MRHPRNEGTKMHSKLLSITIETEFEPKAADSVIRVALSSLGTVKEIKVIAPEATAATNGAEDEESSKQ
jgi:hypothetical protein